MRKLKPMHRRDHCFVYHKKMIERMWTNQGCRDGSNCLLYKHEDLSSITQNPGKKLRVAASACHPGTGETEDLTCLPATLSSELQFFFERLCLKKQGGLDC